MWRAYSVLARTERRFTVSNEVYFVKSVRLAIKHAQKMASKRWGSIGEIVKVKPGEELNGHRTVRVRLEGPAEVHWFTINLERAPTGWVIQPQRSKMEKRPETAAFPAFFNEGTRVRLARRAELWMITHDETLLDRKGTVESINDSIDTMELTVGKEGSLGTIKHIWKNCWVGVEFDGIDMLFHIPDKCLNLA